MAKASKTKVKVKAKTKAKAPKTKKNVVKKGKTAARAVMKKPKAKKAAAKPVAMKKPVAKKKIAIKDNFNIYEGDIYLRQNLNDTVFKIIEGNQSVPYLQFKMGSFKCPAMQMPREELSYFLFIDDIK